MQEVLHETLSTEYSHIDKSTVGFEARHSTTRVQSQIFMANMFVKVAGLVVWCGVPEIQTQVKESGKIVL